MTDSARKLSTITLFALIVAISTNSHSCAQAPLPKLVNSASLHSYLNRHLNASPEQIAQIEQIYNDYSARWSTSFNKDIREFNAKWKAAFTAPQHFVGEGMDKAFQEANTVAERLASQLSSANDLFFDSIEVLLADAQLPGMQRVRFAHDRVSFRRSGNVELRELQVDVIGLVEKMEVTPEEQVAIEVVLAGFEPVYVAAMKRVAEIDQRSNLLIFAAIELARQNSNSGVDAARLAEGNRLSIQADRLRYPAYRRLVELNRQGLRQICDALAESNRAELRRQYFETEYPEVFLDAAFAHPYYEGVIGELALDDDRITLLSALDESYRREHGRLTGKLAEAVYDLSLVPFTIALRHSGDDYGPSFASSARSEIDRRRATVQSLGLERESLNLEFPGKIQAMLSVEERLQVPPWKYANEQPPRPWSETERR